MSMGHRAQGQQGDAEIPPFWLSLAFHALVAAVLFAVALLGVSLPSVIGHNSTVFPLVNAFGGGIILAAALVHMLPEASTCDQLQRFPWGPFMLAVGYLFLLSVELIVDRSGDKNCARKLGCCRSPSTPPSSLEPLNEGNSPDGNIEGVGHDAEKGMLPPSASHHVPICTRSQPLRTKRCKSHSSSLSQSPLAALAATCGLTVHSLLEGLALGLRTNWGDFAVVAVTIGMHKLFASLALGALLAELDSSCKLKWAGKWAFCLGSPVGIIVGALLAMKASCIVTSPTSAFAGGSLMWVALHEVIGPATETKGLGAVLISTWIGFGLMSVVAVWV